MNIVGRITSLFMLLLCCGSAAAQNTQLDIRYFAPQPGYWISDSQQRNAYGIQVGPDGYLFAAIYTYDAMGMPTFLTVQGSITPATVQQRATGLLSTFSSATFRTSGGTPFGGQQMGTPTTVESEFGSVQMRFFVWGEGDLTVGGQTLPIRPFPLYTNAAPFQPDAIASGVWAMAEVYPTVPDANLGVVKARIARQTTTAYSASNPAGGPGPHPGDIQYSFSCLACDVVSGGAVDPAKTANATSRVGSTLLAYSTMERRWRAYFISQTSTPKTYNWLGFADVRDSQITIINRNGDAIGILVRFPDALGNPGVLPGFPLNPPPPGG